MQGGDEGNRDIGMKDRAHLASFRTSLQSHKGENSYSQMMFALMLLNEPIEPNDVEEAVGWLTKAAESGYTDANLQLGMMYQGGIGVTRDPALAIRWFRKPAEDGNPWAQFSMGELLSEVEGMSGDAPALEWFRKAAALGHAEAKEMLEKLGEGLGKA